LIELDNSILLSLPMKVGEGNPQAREEEGKLPLLSMECNTSLIGIRRMWGLEFHGKATTFTGGSAKQFPQLVFQLLLIQDAGQPLLLQEPYLGDGPYQHLACLCPVSIHATAG